MVKSLVLALFLTGCACKPIIVTPPEPPIIPRPTLESINIDSSMSPGSIIQAFRADIKRLQSTILEYEAALNAYRKESK